MTGAELKELRKRKQLSQEALATSVGYARGAIIRLEAAPENPIPKKLLLLLKALEN